MITFGADLTRINSILGSEFEVDKKKLLFGSSADTYWSVRPGVFARVRERDGILQLTVKSRDMGMDENRLEIDLNCTSSVEDAYEFMSTLYGLPAGVLKKTYYVYWLNKTDTVCCYQVTYPEYQHVIIEVEAATMARMEELVARVKFRLATEMVRHEKAPGSLYDMFVIGESEVSGQNVAE